MADQIQTEMTQTLLLVAISLCFNPEEEYLTEEQILSRGFSPTREFGKTYLQSLVDNETIKCKWIGSSNTLTTDSQVIYFKNPVAEGQSHHLFIAENGFKLLGLFEKSPGNELYFLSLRMDIKAQECVEYADFYANKSRLSIINKNPNNPKLILMLMELKLENVFALIWRSVKIFERHVTVKNDTFEFSDMIDMAFDKYIDAKNKGAALDEYVRPMQIKVSKLSWIAEKLLLEIPKISKNSKAS